MLKPKCCPNTPMRKVPRSVYEAARDKTRAIAQTEAYLVSRRERKKVEMLFAHLKRILGLNRLRLRGPCGAHDEFLLAATAQNLRKLAKLIPVEAPIMAVWGAASLIDCDESYQWQYAQSVSDRVFQRNRVAATVGWTVMLGAERSQGAIGDLSWSALSSDFRGS
jgi:hypothetical protein